ncbi:MAG: DUF4065 domain-containing protein [Bacteroidales bacterium]|nr:DUF4065 domain-containing protein [Candidatus Liminaster caballi]
MRTEREVKDIQSPFTGGKVVEVCDVEEKEFRKEKYMVHVRYYQCCDTGEQFTTDEQDTLMCNDLYGQYRVKHGIPFPEEIKAIRIHYGLNYSQISRILGFGINMYKEYEKGTVPSESNGKMIQMIHSKQGLLTLLSASRGVFDEEEFVKVSERVMACTEYNDKTAEQNLYYGKMSRSVMNGFGEMNTHKLINLIKYLVTTEGGICPTKLNKELFYVDFCHFRQYGTSISGLTYRAIQYGPVPEHFDTIYDNIDGLYKESRIVHEAETVRLYCDESTENLLSIFSEEELHTISYVETILRPMTTSKLVEASHAEDAWIHNQKSHSFIAYTEAFSLRLL